MKAWMKNLLLAGSGLLVLGLAMSGIGFVLGGRPWGKLIGQEENALTVGSSGKKISTVYPIKEVSKIELAIDIGEVELKSGDRFELELENIWAEEFECSYKDAEEKLYISYRTDAIKQNALGLKNRYADGKLILTIPQGIQLEEIELDSGVGEAKLRGISAKKIELAQGVGALNCSEVTADSLHFEGGVGELKGSGLNVKESFSLTSGLGSVELYGEIKGEIEIESGVGDTSLSLENCRAEDYSYSIEPGIGEISIDGQKSSMFAGKQTKNTSTAKNKIQIEGGMGDVVLCFEKGGEK